MAIVYSYPTASIALEDFLFGTKIGQEGKPSKSFIVSDLVNLTISTLQSGGVSGYFVSADDKGITVTNGIITAIDGL